MIRSDQFSIFHCSHSFIRQSASIISHTRKYSNFGPFLIVFSLSSSVMISNSDSSLCLCFRTFREPTQSPLIPDISANAFIKSLIDPQRRPYLMHLWSSTSTYKISFIKKQQMHAFFFQKSFPRIMQIPSAYLHRISKIALGTGNCFFERDKMADVVRESVTFPSSTDSLPMIS